MSGASLEMRTPLPRPEFERDPIDASDVGDVERPLGLIERLTGNDAIRRLAILVVLGVIWELYARWIDNPLS
jgi:NitT/TauT family transport system permease protein